MIKVRILTRTASRGFTADAVLLPGSLAPFEVLPGHAPIISTLDEGRIRWKEAGREESIHIKSGTVRLVSDEMTICAEMEEEEEG